MLTKLVDLQYKKKNYCVTLIKVKGQIYACQKDDNVAAAV